MTTATRTRTEDARSIWEQGMEIRAREQLTDTLTADACVIGAGMAGLNCALLLQRAGLRVVVLEAGRIVGGATQGTTAKITSQHDLIYDRLSRDFGPDTAREYARLNQAAIEKFAEIIGEYQIDCDFARVTHGVYDLGDVQSLQNECAAMRVAGLNAFMGAGADLPFPVAGAVMLPDQARFHPLKYAARIADELHIFERSRALEVKEGRVTTRSGAVSAGAVVVATHYPFINVPGLYFARMHQERSCVLALSGAPAPDAMYIDAADGGLSFRVQGEYLLLGGGSWRTGENREGGQFDRLREKARAMYKGAVEVAHWSSQDCMTPDHLPFVGRYGGADKALYVATGFNKWGMSMSMAAAELLSKMILDGNRRHRSIFDPARLPPSGLKQMATDVGVSIKGLVSNVLPAEAELDDLPSGHGGVVERDGRKLAACRCGGGDVRAVSSVCTHLGCQLHWNPDDVSWDCPCHGSRFDPQGAVITGPAQRDLEAVPDKPE